MITHSPRAKAPPKVSNTEDRYTEEQSHYVVEWWVWQTVIAILCDTVGVTDLVR